MNDIVIMDILQAIEDLKKDKYRLYETKGLASEFILKII